MKNVFIKSLCKAAIAILPLAAIVSSCDFTNRGTDNEKEPAKAVITVSVFDRATGANLSSSATISASCSATVAVSGNVITVTGNKAIAAQTMTISASTSKGNGSTTIQIPALEPTWSYVGNAVIYVGEWGNVVPTPGTKTEAEAQITVHVIDRAQNNADVTAASTITASAGTVAGNVITIKGNKDIKAQTVNIKATYKDETGEDSVSIPAKAEGEFYGCGIVIPVGTSHVDPVTPEAKPAKATITVTVKNRANNDADVTADSEIKAEGEGITVEKNVVTIIGANDIAKQDIAITAIYGELKATETFALKAVKAGKTYDATLTIYVGEKPVIPGEVVTKVEEQKICDVRTYGAKIFLPNATLAHASHASHGEMLNWIENDSEYIFSDYEDFPVYTGSYVFEFDKITDATVKSVAAAYNTGISQYTAKYHVQASAWCIWTLYAQVETYTATYAVYNNTYTGGVLTASEELGKFDVITKNVLVTYEEQAHPGHAAAYHEGEGHAAHGDSNNAGGGIVIAD